MEDNMYELSEELKKLEITVKNKGQRLHIEVQNYILSKNKFVQEKMELYRWNACNFSKLIDKLKNEIEILKMENKEFVDNCSFYRKKRKFNENVL